MEVGEEESSGQLKREKSSRVQHLLLPWGCQVDPLRPLGTLCLRTCRVCLVCCVLCGCVFWVLWVCLLCVYVCVPRKVAGTSRSSALKGGLFIVQGDFQGSTDATQTTASN